MATVDVKGSGLHITYNRENCNQTTANDDCCDRDSLIIRETVVVLVQLMCVGTSCQSYSDLFHASVLLIRYSSRKSAYLLS